MKIPTPAPLTTGAVLFVGPPGLTGPWEADEWRIKAAHGALGNLGKQLLATMSKSVDKNPKVGDCETDSTSYGTSEAEADCIDSGSEEANSQDASPEDSVSVSADLLGNLTFFQRASLILPAISGWAKPLGLTKSLRSIEQLKRQISEHPETRKQAKTALTMGMTTLLRNSIKDFQVQDLMKLLKPEEAPPSIQLSLETLCYEMEQERAKQQKQKGGSNAKPNAKPKQSSKKTPNHGAGQCPAKAQTNHGAGM